MSEKAEILIVDDNINNAIMFQMAFKEILGKESDIATSPAEARKLFDKKYFMFIYDEQLGTKETGFDLAEEYQEQHRVKVYTILHSAYPIDPEHRKKADKVIEKGLSKLSEVVAYVDGILTAIKEKQEIYMLIGDVVVKNGILEKKMESVETSLKIIEGMVSMTRSETKRFMDANWESAIRIMKVCIMGFLVIAALIVARGC